MSSNPSEGPVVARRELGTCRKKMRARVGARGLVVDAFRGCSRSYSRIFRVKRTLPPRECCIGTAFGSPLLFEIHFGDSLRR